MSERSQMSVRHAMAYVRWRLKGRPITPPALSSTTVEEWLDVFGAATPAVPDGVDPLLVIMVCVAPDDERFAASISSILSQTDKAWTLVVVADRSESAARGVSILEEASRDNRISIHRCESADQSMSHCIDAIAGSSPGSHVMLIHGSAVLAPGAVAWFRSCCDDAALIYADEIIATNDERRAVFKPAWSPTLLASSDYLGSVFVIRTDLLRDAGGYGHGLRDLALRLTSTNPVVCHLPNLLFEDDRAQRGSLVRWVDDEERRVQVVIPTRDRVELLERAVDSVLSATGIPNLVVVIVDNGSTDPATLRYLADISKADERVIVCVDDEPFNFSRVCNLGASRGERADVLVFLNNDVSTSDSGWLRQLVGWFDDERVGAVGARLDFPDGRIQHMGVVVGRDQFLGDDIPDGYVPLAAHVGHGLGSEQVAASLFASQREVSALTAACLAVRGESFRALDGFDEELAIDFQDVDLCLRLVTELELSLIYDSTVILNHEESASRGSVGASAPETLQLMTNRWADVLADGDPFFSPHLALDLTMRSVRGLNTDVCESRLAPRLSSDLFRER